MSNGTQQRSDTVTNNTAIIAIDPKTGRHIRQATRIEAATYTAQDCIPCMRRPVRIGNVTVTEFNKRGGANYFNTPGQPWD